MILLRGYMEAHNYQFTAIRGVQSGREYYVVMCPLKLIPKIFVFDEEEVPAELRAQRTLNRSRVPEISQYLIDNSEDYVFSSITASIDGEVLFEPIKEHGRMRDAGTLTVPMSSQFLINDGQHRRAAIEAALKQNPDIGDESISVVFFIDAGLKRSQQMFADLNKHAIRPTKSIGILYDVRDPFSRLAVQLTDEVAIFSGLTEMEKTSISNRSTKVFTLSAVYQATQALLRKKKRDDVTKDDVSLSQEFWAILGEIIPEWRLAIKREASPAELRKQYIHTHGVALHALGISGGALIAEYPDSWQSRLSVLGEVDWRRVNTDLWEGRAMHHGKISKAGQSLYLTVNAIKQILGLSLSAKEAQLEQMMEKNQK
jgi:DNA sulfur modification protein DndB